MIDYSLRIILFLAFFASLLAWQITAPQVKTMRKVKTALKEKTTPANMGQNMGWKIRWFHNFALFGIDALLVRLIQPTLLTLVALHVTNQPFLYQQWFDQQPLLAILIAILLLDMAIYFQHRLSHSIPLLWRLHKVHHSDPKIDVSSAIRFHPLEIILSLLYKSAIIAIFAIPVEAVLLFDILLNSMAMLNHTNGRLFKPLERWIRLVIVTPDMHRIHHSVRLHEANSNYGFFLSGWDRLFASYTASPTDHPLTVGMPKPTQALRKEEQKQQPITLTQLLIMPFKQQEKTQQKSIE
ncbi:sterol desaturase family protein [Marinomonas agarivorans]|nr:sterol desaturase family protein [Marinomonas agarivorans]